MTIWINHEHGVIMTSQPTDVTGWAIVILPGNIIPNTYKESLRLTGEVAS